jgi:transcriptional regulator with XRE-family HTH domain
MRAQAASRSAFGRLLRHWRSLRGLSQLALALRVETTTRHLSYIENGRSRPGRDLVLRIADALDIPLRARNDLLGAAGLPAEFPAHALEGPALAPYRLAIVGLVEALQPFPAFALDSTFHIVEANAVGRRLLPPANGARLNLIDVFLAPGPARESLANFAEVAWSWHSRFLRSVSGPGVSSPELDALRSRVEGYLRDVPRPRVDASGELVVCPTFRVDGRLIRTIGMTMRFGPTRDVTLEELAVDVLYPRDEDAARYFRALADVT